MLTDEVMYVNALLEKYNDYMRLHNYRVEYVLSNGIKIEVSYKEENFAHLLGLHKLKDVQLIQFWLDKANKSVKLSEVLRRIRNSTFTDEMVRSSIFFSEIQKRYEKFSYENLTTLNYTNAVINFDAAKIKSKIKSDYLLFEKSDQGYDHLGIAIDNQTGNRYFETFFHEATNLYVAGQEIVEVEEFLLYDANNEIVVSDSF